MISIRDAAAQSGGVVHICIGNRDSELTDPVLRIMNKRDNKWWRMPAMAGARLCKVP